MDAAVKTCRDCGVSKTTAAFDRNGTATRDGLHPYCKDCRAVRRRDHYVRDAEGIKARQIVNARKYRYGLTDKQYRDLLDAQDGRCAICGDVMAPPHVDHCHTSGTVRGLLCNNCNKALGHLKDDPTRLLAAADYLLGFRSVLGEAETATVGVMRSL